VTEIFALLQFYMNSDLPISGSHTRRNGQYEWIGVKYKCSMFDGVILFGQSYTVMMNCTEL
jgi:D-serine dehydratase